VAETRISRRDFLKFMGAGAAAVGLGAFGFTNLFNNSRYNNNLGAGRASAQSAGSWDSPVNQPLETTTVHAALIEGGKVFWLMGSGNNEPHADGPYRHGTWNPDGSFGSTNTVGDDLFCCGMTTLANGNVLLCGGTLDYDHQTLNGKFHGGKFAYEVDFSSGSVGNRTEMAHGRWYPTCITLPDGKVFVVQGWDEYGCNNRLIEFYDPSSKSWQIRLDPAGNGTYCVGNCATDYYPGQAGSPCYGPGTAPYLSLYPRFHLMPSGLLASVGGELDDRVYDPNTFKWVWSGKTIKRHYGTSVLCPLENVDTEKGKILVCGGSPQAPDPATNTAEIVVPSGTVGLSRRSVQSMQHARKHIGPVILPTGQIVIFGGNLKTNLSPVLNPEMFDPVTETWTVWPAATVPRMYHQVSLLLHDGRVWTAGTTPTQAVKEVRVEIFNPWYTSETRPTISGDPTGGAYGGTITIPTPDAADITKVSLIKVSATTHHYNSEQRLIWLQIQGTTSSSVTVNAPINNKLAPPGYYLVHVLNSAGVPSVGKFIKIPGSGGNPPPSDTIAPTVAVTSPANGATISGPSTGVTVNVAGTASDNSGGSGIQKVEVQVGSANQFKLATPTGPGGSADWSTWSASDTVTTEGNHTVTARATDNANNTQDSTVTVTVAFSGGGGTTYTSIYSVAGSNNYAKLSTGTIVRAGELMHKTATLNSALIGQPVKRVNVILKKSGNPTGTISVVVRKVTGDSIVHTFGTINASTLTTSDNTFTLEATSSHTIAANDRILVEWNGTGSSTDQVWVKKSASSTSGGFDGQNTKWTQYVTAYSNQGGYDLAGEWFKLT
jgi:Domain of unknown function (DUF1929)/Bacterial Ig domain/TAT (twin-arginine translocation) pathway signal sequence